MNIDDVRRMQAQRNGNQGRPVDRPTYSAQQSVSIPIAEVAQLRAEVAQLRAAVQKLVGAHNALVQRLRGGGHKARPAAAASPARPSPTPLEAVKAVEVVEAEAVEAEAFDSPSPEEADEIFFGEEPE